MNRVSVPRCECMHEALKSGFVEIRELSNGLYQDYFITENCMIGDCLYNRNERLRLGSYTDRGFKEKKERENRAWSEMLCNTVKAKESKQ